MFVRIAVLWLLMGLAACTSPLAGPRQTVSTDYGLGPDKWASAWLMARHAVPGADLVVVPQGKPVVAGIAFDVSTAPLRRARDRAAFQTVVEHYKLTEPGRRAVAESTASIRVNH